MAIFKDVEPLELVTYQGESEDFDRGAMFILEKLDALPVADVEEVVRCKDCKCYEPHGNGKAGICRNRKCKGLRYATDFCSYGESESQKEG